MISGSEGKPLTVVVVRDGARITLPATRPQETDGAYRLGFVLAGEGLPLPAATGEAFVLTGRGDTGDGEGARPPRAGGRRGGHREPGRASCSGSSDAAKDGAQSFFFVLGLISLSVALLNLLPFLPLDGGHIVFAIAEGIRGRAVRREIYERVSIVGIVLVVLLFFVGLSNDIDRLS